MLPWPQERQVCSRLHCERGTEGKHKNPNLSHCFPCEGFSRDGGNGEGLMREVKPSKGQEMERA